MCIKHPYKDILYFKQLHKLRRKYMSSYRRCPQSPTTECRIPSPCDLQPAFLTRRCFPFPYINSSVISVSIPGNILVMAECGQTAQDVAKGALSASLKYVTKSGGDLSINISTSDAQVVRDVVSDVVGTVCKTAVTLGALYAGHQLMKHLIECAVKRAFGGERDDQEIQDIKPGSLNVLLHCLTDERFLEVLNYYESGILKGRLQKEFSQIGIEMKEMKVEILNKEEVNKIKEAINIRGIKENPTPAKLNRGKARDQGPDVMSDNQKTTNVVGDLKENLRSMPDNLCRFSSSMRSLYADKAVGTSTDVARKFRKLRDDTRQDAILYLKCHFPKSIEFVSSIKEYFEYYQVLTYEEWCETLPDILEETKIYKERAQKLLEMHEKLMIPLKKRADEAKIIVTEFKDLESKFEKQKEKLEVTAKIKTLGAVAVSLVSDIARNDAVSGNVCSQLLVSQAKEDSAEATAYEAQSKVNKDAAHVVAETLIPALSSFIDGLRNAAGFFGVMEQELESFERKAEENIKSPKLLHYKMMKKEAEEMKSLCQAFYAELPSIRTDFEAIPNEGTDQNYVDKWLEKQLSEIEEKKNAKKKKAKNKLNNTFGIGSVIVPSAVLIGCFVLVYLLYSAQYRRRASEF